MRNRIFVGVLTALALTFGFAASSFASPVSKSKQGCCTGIKHCCVIKNPCCK